MPIHDWTRVTAGTWHDFHIGWVHEIICALNSELLHDCYFAMAEHAMSELDESEVPLIGVDAYALKRRTIVIRHENGDRVVAFLEIVSPGNKSNPRSVQSFVEKAVEALYRGYHLLIIDLFPPGPRNPDGIHARIWGEFSDEEYHLSPDEPLTLAAYSAGQRKRGYIEPTAVGRTLIDMPLFLTPEMYVNVPLEATYQAAYRGVPRRWKEVLEAPKV